MSAVDYSPIARVATDLGPMPKLTAGQQRAWVREVEARFEGDVRDELVAMLGVEL